MLKSVSADSFSVEFSDGAKKVTSASDLAGREFAGSGGKLTDASAPTSSGDNTMMYVAIGAAAVVALLVVAFLVMRSRKSR